MKTVITDRQVWDVVKRATGLDNKAAHKLAVSLTNSLNRICESALRMDRVELRAELEEATEKKFKRREEALARREDSSGGMTREELVKILAETVEGEGDSGTNVQAARLLYEMENYGAKTQDITILMIDYSDAPEEYFASRMPGDEDA